MRMRLNLRQARKMVLFTSHKQCKTLFKDPMVRLKIISLYIYKDLSLSFLGDQPSVQSSVWFLFRSCFSALRPKIEELRKGAKRPQCNSDFMNKIESTI